MPLRGESVGTAYVRILADGSGLPRSIKDQFDEAEDGVRAAGADHDKAYEKGFDDESKKNKTLEKSLTKKVQEAFGKMDADADLLGRGFEEKISRAISGGIASSDDKDALAHAYEIGDRVANKIAQGINEGKGVPSFSRGGLQKMISSALNDILTDEEKFEREWRAGFDKIDADTRKASRGLVSALGDMDRGLSRTRSSLLGLGGHLEKDLKKPAEEGAQGLNNFRTKLNKVDNDIDKFADRLGTTFGHGARNNFVNFIGSGVRGFALLLNVVPKLTKGFLKIKDGFGDIVAAFHSGEGGALSLGAGFTKLAETMGTSVAGLVAMAAGVAALELLIGPLVSIISGLIAALTALAGSLTFAAAGALGALVGAVLPLVAGIGVLIIGIQNLAKKHMPALKAAAAPVTKAFKELGSTAGDVFVKALPKLKELGPVLSSLKPLVRGVATGLVSGFTSFINVLKGPAFKAFTTTFTKFLPGAVASLGHIFASTFSGLLGLFRSLVPITSSFLGWLQKITGEFANFTNSKKGQQDLLTFFDRAATSAQSVGHFLGSIGGLLSALFSQGKDSGDNIFGSMTKSIHSLTDYLNTHKGAVSQWFANGVQVARDVGGAIRDIGVFLGSLDTAQNRAIAHDVVGNIGVAFKVVNAAMGLAYGTLGTVVQAFQGLVNVGKSVISLFQGHLSAAFGYAVIALGHFAKGLGSLIGALGNIPGFGWAKKAGAALKAAGDKAIGFGNDIVDLGNKVKGLPTKKTTNLSVRANGLAVPGVSAQMSTLIGTINRMPPSKKANVHATANGGSITAITNQFRSLAASIAALHDKTVTVHVRNKSGGTAPGGGATARGGLFDYGERMAAGGLVQSMKYRTIGEAGPEAVVPLSRPLGEVDPSVRLLSAFAQGKLGSAGIGKQVNVGGITLVTPTADPHAAATEVINRLVPYI